MLRWSTAKWSLGRVRMHLQSSRRFLGQVRKWGPGALGCVLPSVFKLDQDLWFHHQVRKLIAIDLASLSVPELSWLTRDKIEPFLMHP